MQRWGREGGGNNIIDHFNLTQPAPLESDRMLERRVKSAQLESGFCRPVLAAGGEGGLDREGGDMWIWGRMRNAHALNKCTLYSTEHAEVGNLPPNRYRVFLRCHFIQVFRAITMGSNNG